MQPNPTLDQLQVFVAVAETGSFSAAARRLNRSQSVVSYTIANLEAQLELQLFERGGTREPRLTEAGTAMLEDARRMVSVLQSMRSRAEGLKHGLEAEVAVAVDVSLPSPVLTCVLKAFQTAVSDGQPAPACRGARDGLGSRFEKAGGFRHWRPTDAGPRRACIGPGRANRDDTGCRARSPVGPL